MIKASLVVACRNEEKYISILLDSLLQQDYPAELIEVLIIDGVSEDRTKEIVKERSQSCITIKLLNNPLKVSTAAFNKGVLEAEGDYIFLIGSHCKYPMNYISRLISCAETYQADITGGILETQAMKTDSIAHAITKVLSNRLGVGNATFRTGSTNIMEVDTVPYGCYRKDTFQRYGLFNDKLIRNQDIEMNKRIRKGGGKIMMIPDVVITYYARADLKGMAKNSFQNGYWNPLTIFYSGSFDSLSLRHYIPAFFVLFVLIFGCLSLFSSFAFYCFLAVILTYLLILGITSYHIRDSSTTWWQLIKAFVTLHFSYGIGSLTGLMKICRLKFTGRKR